MQHVMQMGKEWHAEEEGEGQQDDDGKWGVKGGPRWDDRNFKRDIFHRQEVQLEMVTPAQER